MTDLPDAETAWPTWYHENIERLWELEGRERDEALFTAGFAAASGPWAELRADLKIQQKQNKELAAERDAALARNAELKQDFEDEYNRAVAFMVERDAARAELDSLRDRVNALADRYYDHPEGLRGISNVGECVAYELRAIVRGSDDE